MRRNQSNVAISLASAGDRAELLLIEEEREMLLRAIGHELRSPLTAISLGIHLVQRDSSSKTRILAMMKSTVQRMDRLIEELLRFARGDTGEAVAKREAVSFQVAMLKRRQARAPRDDEQGERP
jgi:sigma-B regulation protein RsbU (phosphoserine phosphatase)